MTSSRRESVTAEHDHEGGDDHDHTHGVPSTAAISGHPVHPILVGFPIVFLVAVFMTDIAYTRTNDAFWARVSVWLVGAGLVTGTAAAFAGFIDFATIPRAREHVDGWIHFIGNFLVLLLAGASTFVRVSDPVAHIWPWGFLLSAATVGLLAVTGWYGGELVFRHMIGVIGHGPEPAVSADAFDAEFLRRHSEFDHHIFGWAAALIAAVTIVHSFTDALDPLWHWWPVPWLIVSLYFTRHMEPDVKRRYRSWMAAWADKPTRDRRIINIGGVVATLIELGMINAGWQGPGLGAVLPLGQIAAGMLFLGHHHSDESGVGVRQHQIISAVLVAAGTSLGAARLLPALAPLGNAWPWLLAILAFVYVTYSEHDLTAHDHAGHA